MAAEHRNVKARAVERSINRPVPSDWQRLITRSIEWRSMVAVLLSTQRIELKQQYGQYSVSVQELVNSDIILHDSA